MIRTNYDPEADVLHIAFGPEGGRSDTSQEVAPGVYAEFDPEGQMIGLEVTSASRRGRPAVSAQAA